MTSAVVFLHALSPLHAGIGQGIEGIDLPVARERSTGLPILPGSTIKGCLKDHQRVAGNPNLVAVFGPDKVKSSDFAGAVSIGDGRLLLFPVRSLAHTFLWVTCPFVLNRFSADCNSAHLSAVPGFTHELSDQEIATADPTATVELGPNRKAVVLEELDLTLATHAQPDASALGRWFSKHLYPSIEGQAAETPDQRSFRKRFAIVNDDNFFFLARTGTEVQAHIAIDHVTGTVIEGALWYQESLPAETILVSIVQANDERSEKPQKLPAEEVLRNAIPGAVDGRQPILQFGGKSSTGLGWTRLLTLADLLSS